VAAVMDISIAAATKNEEMERVGEEERTSS
jgi:hypothetical protein